jgi:hypothetical protein
MIATRSRMAVAGLIAIGAVALVLGIARAKDPKAELQDALHDHAIDGDWNYDDIKGGRRRAAREKKPVLVVFR